MYLEKLLSSSYVRIVQPYWGWITLINLALISYLSLLPLDHVPEVMGGDKLHHFMAYAGLIFLVAWRKPVYWWVWGIAFMVWGGAIEFIQPYVNRHAEWLDFAVNTLGLLFGALLGEVCRKVSKV